MPTFSLLSSNVLPDAIVRMAGASAGDVGPATVEIGQLSTMMLSLLNRMDEMSAVMQGKLLLATVQPLACSLLMAMCN